MQPKSIIVFAVIFLALLSYRTDTVAQRIDKAAYSYPYKNPFVATATVALMQGQEALPSGKIRDLRISVIGGRDNIHLLEGKGKLRYRFYQQKGPAPLIFIIPGIASSAYVGSARFLAEYLAGNGFHVLVLPSPFNWNFTLAASNIGVAGLTREDAKDLYTAMQLTLEDARRQRRVEIGKIGLLGLSEGAVEAAYVDQLDDEQRKIGIGTTLMINPPVDLLEAAEKIDAMAAEGKSYSPGQRKYLEDYAVGTVANALQNDPNSPDYFAGWDSRARLTDRQLKYLIGNEFQKALGDTIYTSDLAFNLGVLHAPISSRMRTPRFNEARSYAFLDYLKTLLIPRIQQLNDRQMSVEKIDTQNSLKAQAIRATLENDKHIYLMHNLDDFLVSTEDIAFLRQVFGDRAIFYPHGGHLGNLWYADNKQAILNIFQPLLQGTAGNR